MTNATGGLKAELTKKIAAQVESLTYKIDKDEFMHITFDNQWPKIVADIAKHLTGLNELLKPTRINESEEFQNQFNPREWFSDGELNIWRGTKLTMK